MLEPLHEPVAVFLTIMAVILVTPLISEWLHLPGIVGLLLGGLFVGPHILGLLHVSQTIELLGTVGLIYLMFSAGLEIDLHQLGRVRNRAMLFGALTFSIPLLTMAALGRALGLGWASSILLGATFASHTLIAYPIISRLGLARNEAIAVVVGATVFTDVASLLVLAIVAGARDGGLSVWSLARLLALVVGYALLVLLGLPRVGKLFFRYFTSRNVEFQFVLVALFIAAILAERIGMHAIVGAFLAGLAINAVLPSRSAVGSQILFLGSSFFVPIFLIYVGMNIDPLAFVVDRETLLIGVTTTIAVYIAKFVAAWIPSRLFGYGRDELMTFWGLSQAQAAATIATILVGVEVGLFPTAVFNGAILSVLCTCITSPILVQRFGRRLHRTEAVREQQPIFSRTLVPIANPHTQEYLLTLASILCRDSEGTLLPLHIAREVHGRVIGLEHQRQLLADVPDILQDPECSIEPVRRVDTSVPKGILHAAAETDASVIVMGWHGRPPSQGRMFGSILDEVIWNASVPVVVGRMATAINATRRVVLAVPIGSMPPGLAGPLLDTVTAIARALNAPLLVLSSEQYTPILQSRLEAMDLELTYDIAHLSGDPIQDTANKVSAQDLIVIPTSGSRILFRSSLGGIPEQLARAVPNSLVVIHWA